MEGGDSDRENRMKGTLMKRLAALFFGSFLVLGIVGSAVSAQTYADSQSSLTYEGTTYNFTYFYGTPTFMVRMRTMKRC